MIRNQLNRSNEHPYKNSRERRNLRHTWAAHDAIVRYRNSNLKKPTVTQNWNSLVSLPSRVKREINAQTLSFLFLIQNSKAYFPFLFLFILKLFDCFSFQITVPFYSLAMEDTNSFQLWTDPLLLTDVSWQQSTSNCKISLIHVPTHKSNPSISRFRLLICLFVVSSSSLADTDVAMSSLSKNPSMSDSDSSPKMNSGNFFSFRRNLFSL